MIYIGALSTIGCGRTPLGDPFGTGGDDSTTLTPTPTPSGSATPTPTAAPCGDCSAPTGFDSGLVKASVPVNSVAYDSGHKIFLCHDATGFYAMTSLCTHLQCDMGGPSGVYSASNLGGGFHCNCHGSNFFADGSVKNGPAGSALFHYKVAIDPGQRIFIDQGVIVAITCRCAG